MDIYSIGEMVIDFLPGNEPGCYIRNAGGAPANMAIASSRNGLDAGFCGLLGDDDFGRFLKHTLEENHVRVLCNRMTPHAVTTMAFVSLTPDGERSFTFARKPGADMLLSTDDVKDEHIRSATVIHAGSCSLSKGTQVDATMYAMRKGVAYGKMISFDVNYRELIWDGDTKAAVKMIREALPYTDVLKVSEDETILLGGDLPALMKEFNIQLVVETLGANGSRCFHAGVEMYAPSPKVTCVDATGAGDAFWGAFIAGLLRRGVRHATQINTETLGLAMAEGNIAGALSVQKKGAISSLPTRAEIEKQSFK